MISICIPVYNYNVLPLVEALSAIRDKQSLDVEIIVADDGSDQETRKQNEAISDWKGVFYFEKEENVGRSAIRNFLASKSTKEYILFIDADSILIEDDILYQVDMIKDKYSIIASKQKSTGNRIASKLLWFAFNNIRWVIQSRSAR